MALRIAICDEAADICHKLSRMIEQYFMNIKKHVIIEIFHRSKVFYDEMRDGRFFELIFLEIEMQGANGIEIGKLIRREINNETIKIVYISWKDSYAMDLFQVRPLEFMIKPIRFEKVAYILDIAIKLIDEESDYVIYQHYGLREKIPFSVIMYIISENKKIAILTTEKKFEFSGKLNDLESTLDRQYFWRIHQSYIINYKYVKRFQYTKVCMMDGNEFSISQKYRVCIRNKQKNLLAYGSENRKYKGLKY